MKNQFVTYEIALKLKDLGFDEKCLGRYGGDQIFCYAINYSQCKNSVIKRTRCSAPLWQQVIDWFREKHNLNIEVNYLPNISKYGIVVSDKKFIPKDNSDTVNYMHGSTVTCSFYKSDDFDQAREQAILKAIDICKN